MPELARPARIAFIVAFLGLQLALIFTADLRPDRIFSFRMFNESSKLSFELFREVTGRRGPRRVPVRNGVWQARTAAGNLTEFRWTDRVRFGSLTRTSVLIHTPYGLDAQLFRLQKALEDVAAHIPDDTETRALIAVADTVKNGRPAGRVTLRAARP